MLSDICQLPLCRRLIDELMLCKDNASISSQPVCSSIPTGSFPPQDNGDGYVATYRDELSTQLFFSASLMTFKLQRTVEIFMFILGAETEERRSSRLQMRSLSLSLSFSLARPAMLIILLLILSIEKSHLNDQSLTNLSMSG